MTLGRLLYLFYHAPRGSLERSYRAGGPIQQWITHRGQAAMRAAAGHLTPHPAPPTTAPRIAFLTGKKFWYQTAFCASSLLRVADRPLAFEFIDDGTFDSAFATEAFRIFPGCLITTTADATARLDDALPVARFPSLRSQRLTYLHLRKLTDVHAGSTGPRLVLDSDMLFFRRPTALLAWFDDPAQPIHMLDVADAYGYPTATLNELAGTTIASLVNVGILGLHSERIDWVKLEHACTTLLARHGTSYYLEQALSALLLTNLPAQRLPVADYRLLPTEAECRVPTAALHHYVAESKRGYFRHAWRHIHL
jgi:hypothetical protein